MHHAETNSPSEELPPASERIPEYELLRLIGKGAQGEVWLARSFIGQYRAVKIVRRGTVEQARQFEREFSALRHYEPLSREHPGLVQVLHAGRGDAEEFLYYVMELADDAHDSFPAMIKAYAPRTLAWEIKHRGPLPVKECLVLGRILAGTLDYLHSNQLVHRDLKPSNIIYVKGRPKLADIGLVLRLDELASLVGTLGYTAPEGAGKTSGDVFGLGRTLAAAWTGQNPPDYPATSYPNFRAMRWSSLDRCERTFLFAKWPRSLAIPFASLGWKASRMSSQSRTIRFISSPATNSSGNCRSLAEMPSLSEL